ncbi:MAG: YitT family protein [Desulfovibrionaceae bacterium]
MSTTDKRGFTLRGLAFSVPYNLALITLGAAFIAFGIKAVAIPHGFLTGGMAGAGLLAYYLVGVLEPGQWFWVLNIPIFVLAWCLVSRRFFLYSLFGMIAVGMFMDIMPQPLVIHDTWLAVFTCGAFIGVGGGLALRSLGSTGGTDILAVIAYQRYNMNIGQFRFFVDLCVFALGFFFLDLERMLYSLAMTFVVGAVVDYSLNVFNERKMVMIISSCSETIMADVLEKLHRGATYLYGRGAYSKIRKKVVLVMVNNIQLKRLEELVYNHDPEAFLIIGSGYKVLGRGFSMRKEY